MNANPEITPATDNDMQEDYINTIAELKANSVSKEQYEKLKSENRQLLTTLAKGGQIEVQQEVDVNALWEDLFNVKKKPLSNIEVVDRLMKIREATQEKENRDIFVDGGINFVPEAQDYASAQQAADVYKKCLDDAEGSNRAFTAELMDDIRDNVIRRG